MASIDAHDKVANPCAVELTCIAIGKESSDTSTEVVALGGIADAALAVSRISDAG